MHFTTSLTLLTLAGCVLPALAAPPRNVNAAKKVTTKKTTKTTKKTITTTTYSVPGYINTPFPKPVSSDGRFFKYPLNNGFPNPNQDAVNAIQAQAGGTLPNGAPPSSLAPDSLVNLRLIAFAELFEVAFFTQLLQNITNNVPGYRPAVLGNDYLSFLTKTLAGIQAQEEEHALNANGALAAFDADGIGAIKPCEYQFPVSNLGDALAFASEFTTLVLGTLQDVINHFTAAGDVGPLATVASVIAQEGEQNGYFRSVLGFRATPQGFKTGSTRTYAWTALQLFVKPGSCPQDITKFGLTQLPEILQVQQPSDTARVVRFQIKNAASVLPPNTLLQDLKVAFVNGQNKPIVQNITAIANAMPEGARIIKTDFPYTKNAPLGGMTVAALVPAGTYENIDQVNNATLAGPGLIFVN